MAAVNKKAVGCYCTSTAVTSGSSLVLKYPATANVAGGIANAQPISPTIVVDVTSTAGTISLGSGTSPY